jgi:broad specificity phosphatase PhoE
LRHGESTWNAQKRCQGQADPPLSDLGMQSVVDLAPSLLRFGFCSVVTSDLRRARQTADVLAAGLELKPPRSMPDLRERDMGAFTGLTNAEIETTYPQWIEQVRAGLRPDPPGAESRDVLLRRARKGLLRAAEDGDRPTLVVTHGGLLEAVAADLGMTDSRFWNLHGYWLSVADDDSMQYTESFPPH